MQRPFIFSAKVILAIVFLASSVVLGFAGSTVTIFYRSALLDLKPDFLTAWQWVSADLIVNSPFVLVAVAVFYACQRGLSRLVDTASSRLMLLDRSCAGFGLVLLILSVWSAVLLSKDVRW